MGLIFAVGRVAANGIHYQNQRAVFNNERTQWDVDDPNWIMDIQCNLMLSDDTQQAHDGFRRKIRIINGSAANIMNIGQVNTIIRRLNFIWNKCTEAVNDSIKKAKSDRIKHLMISFLFVILGLIVFCVCAILEGIDYKVLLFVISIFLLLPICITLCYQNCIYPKQMSKIREVWRQSFLRLTAEYIDELQTNYNDTNVKFAVLYPMHKPIGAAQGFPFVFIRLSNGIMAHHPNTVYHSTENEQIEGGETNVITIKDSKSSATSDYIELQK